MENTANNKVKKKTNPVLRVLAIIFYVLIAVIIVAGIIGIVGKIKGKGNGLGLFGFNFYVVVTPSMANVNEKYADFLEGHNDRIQVGDLIVTRKLKKNEQPKVYDVVTFIQGGKVIVHRVVDVETGDSGTTFYTTRGDSNATTDGSRTIDEFTGILEKNMGSKAGTIVNFIQSYYGIASVAGAIAIILVAILVNDSLKKKEEKKQLEEAHIAELKAAQAQKAATNAGAQPTQPAGTARQVAKPVGTAPQANRQGTNRNPVRPQTPTGTAGAQRPTGTAGAPSPAPQQQTTKPLPPKNKPKTQEELDMERLYGDFTWSMDDDKKDGKK